VVNKISNESKENHIEFIWLEIEQFAKERVLPIALQKALIKWLKQGRLFWMSQVNDKVYEHN